MNISRYQPDLPLLIQGSSSFLLIGQVTEPFTLFIETSVDEYCQYLSSGDLIVVSAPEGGDVRQAEILLELIIRWHSPLVVLPSGHPGSTRLNMVVSAGDRITMSCSIQRGTHPEQTVLCSSDELAGITLIGNEQGIEIVGLPDSAKIIRLQKDISITGQ